MFKHTHLIFFPKDLSPPSMLRWWSVLLTMRETWVQSLDREDPLEKEMATHSSTLAWKIPWMEKRGGLQLIRSQRVRHDWATPLVHDCFLKHKKNSQFNDNYNRAWVVNSRTPGGHSRSTSTAVKGAPARPTETRAQAPSFPEAFSLWSPVPPGSSSCGVFPRATRSSAPMVAWFLSWDHQTPVVATLGELLLPY